MPHAVVTGSPERVPEITIALKSAGFDILAAGAMSADDAPDLKTNSIDCYVQLPAGAPAGGGRPLDRARALVADEGLARVEVAARFLPLLAPGATVVIVTSSDTPEFGTTRIDPDIRTVNALAGLLVEAIRRDGGGKGVRASVIGRDRTPEEVAALAGRQPSGPQPWWSYAGVDTDLAFADWRDSICCLNSAPPP